MMTVQPRLSTQFEGATGLFGKNSVALLGKVIALAAPAFESVRNEQGISSKNVPNRIDHAAAAFRGHAGEFESPENRFHFDNIDENPIQMVVTLSGDSSTEIFDKEDAERLLNADGVATEFLEPTNGAPRPAVTFQDRKEIKASINSPPLNTLTLHVGGREAGALHRAPNCNGTERVTVQFAFADSSTFKKK